jgi:hypothetical protein
MRQHSTTLAHVSTRGRANGEWTMQGALVDKDELVEIVFGVQGEVEVEGEAIVKVDKESTWASKQFREPTQSTG